MDADYENLVANYASAPTYICWYKVILAKLEGQWEASRLEVTLYIVIYAWVIDNPGIRRK